MKHNGTIAADFIMHMNFTGTGRLVLVSADDPGANSSQNEEDTRILLTLMDTYLFLIRYACRGEGDDQGGFRSLKKPAHASPSA